MEIQWYPGHMAKAKRLLQSQLSKVDLVIELCDARLPLSSRNPALNELVRHKRRILLLCKADLAENVKTFVNMVNRYPYDMDLRAGRHVVDAKSILGIFSLDLSKPITLEVYSDECDDLMNDIKPFMA